ncbi:MAG: pseudaminic acid synthase [Candidatus Auribacterota bacterium]|nr:pseudaminic acid synthase [Candidatus Auribacterota bacterium]
MKTDNFIKKQKRCFIIAEISANHGQNFNRAVAMIKKAKKCGVDAVKFQTYTPDTLTIDSCKRYFKINHPQWGGQTLYKLYSKAYTPWHWFKKLKKIANNEGLMFFSTAFDKTAVDFLEEIDVPLHKIASFELVDIPLIEYMAKTKKPLILSTGMANLSEIREAVNAAKKSGSKDITLLRCVSSYPARPQEMNIRTITDMKKRFNLPVGLSDHTMGAGVSVAAVALGACMIEKHFTLSRKIKSPDSFFSLELAELKNLVGNIRMVEDALGKTHYGLTPDQKKSRVFRRSLFVVKDIKKGEKFTEDNVCSIRPANGVKPKYLKKILGRKAKKNIKRGMPFNLEYIS